MKVLIVHRQQEFLQRIKEKFISGGWFVHVSDNGLDGLLTARHYSFDLILCGFELPVVSGTELVRTCRTLSQNTKTPVFFIKSKSETTSLLELVSQLEANVMDEEAFDDSYRIGWLDSEYNSLN